MFRCEARVVLGIGAKGGLNGLIDFRRIVEFIQYIYHQLKDNNFAFLRFVEEAAFNAMVQVTLLLVEGIVDVADAAVEVIEAALTRAFEPIADANAAEAFARKVQARPTALIFAAPEAKGAILYKLSERFVWSWEERQEAAILTVIGTLQSRREWEQVVERITIDGTKSSAATGLARLRAVLDGGSERKFESMIRAINTLPPATLYAGTPVVVRNLA